MSKEDFDKEEVGYGKPPQKTRFKKGKSGNPKGRPKGKKKEKEMYLRELITDVLSAPIMMRQGSKLTSVTKLRALITQMLQDALQGNTKTKIDLMRLLIRYDLIPLGSSESDNQQGGVLIVGATVPIEEQLGL